MAVVAEQVHSESASDDEIVERARKLFDAQRYPDVVDLATRHLAFGIGRPSLLSLGGLAARKTGDSSAADRLYKLLLCTQPGYLAAYRQLFKIQGQGNKAGGDLTMLYRARVVDPSSPAVAKALSEANTRNAQQAGQPGPDGQSSTASSTVAGGAASAASAGESEPRRHGVRGWILTAAAPPFLMIVGGVAGYLASEGGDWYWQVCAAALGALLPLVVLEMYGFARLTGESGEIALPERRLRQETNSYIGEVTEDWPSGKGGQRNRRSFAETLIPHPYLGYVNRPSTGLRATNNYGLFNRDFPYERDTQSFHVLVTGGSVAAQFAQMNAEGPRYLETALNRRFVPPKGKQFRVFNGALGGWRYPQQVVISAMTVSAMDAVVTLDGFNEAAMMLRDGSLIETPGNKFLGSNLSLKHGYERMICDWLAGRVYEFSLRHWWIRNSNFFTLLSQKLRQSLVSTFDQSGDEKRLMSFFEMPKMGRKRRWQFAVNRYVDYIRFMHGACRQTGVASAHFLQPIPGLGKQLSDQEAAYPKPLGDELVRLYRQMDSAVERLAGSEGVAAVSLVNVFADRTDTVYADWPHCVRDRATGESEGYRLMAEAMAMELGRLWSLREKSPDG